jgi:hypothetical protein
VARGQCGAQVLSPRDLLGARLSGEAAAKAILALQG